MSMRAWAAANGTRGKIFREVVADAGFAVPFNVSSNGSYHITVNWTVDWNASAKGSGCTASTCTYGLASAAGWVYVVAGYRNGIGRCFFGGVSSNGTTVYGSGHANVSCTAFGYLLKAGQVYKVRTWVAGSVELVADGHRSASGTFVMSGPLHGGTLISVWVH